MHDPVTIPESFPELPEKMQAAFAEMKLQADVLNRRQEELEDELLKILRAKCRMRMRLAHYMRDYDHEANRLAQQAVMQTVRLRKSILDRGGVPEDDPEFLEAVERMQTMQRLAQVQQTGANGRARAELERKLQALTGDSHDRTEAP